VELGTHGEGNEIVEAEIEDVNKEDIEKRKRGD
jgi:hypothetical protein